MYKASVFLLFIFLVPTAQSMRIGAQPARGYHDSSDSLRRQKEKSFFRQAGERLKSKARGFFDFFIPPFNRALNPLFKDHRPFFQKETNPFSMKQSALRNQNNFLPLSYQAHFDCRSLLNGSYLPYCIFFNPFNLKEGAVGFLQEMFSAENLNQFLLSKKADQEPIILYVDQEVLFFLENCVGRFGKNSRSWEYTVSQTNILLIGTTETSKTLLQKKCLYKNIACLNLWSNLDTNTLDCLKSKDLSSVEVNFYQKGHLLDNLEAISNAKLTNCVGMLFNDDALVRSTDLDYVKKVNPFLFPQLKRVVFDIPIKISEGIELLNLMNAWAPSLERISLPDHQLDLDSPSDTIVHSLKKIRHLKALYVRDVLPPKTENALDGFNLEVLSTIHPYFAGTTTNDKVLFYKDLTDTQAMDYLLFATKSGQMHCRLQGLFPMSFPFPRETEDSSFFLNALSQAYEKQAQWQDLNVIFYKKNQAAAFVHGFSQISRIKRASFSFAQKEAFDESVSWKVLQNYSSLTALRFVFSFKVEDPEILVNLFKHLPTHLGAVFFSFSAEVSTQVKDKVRELIAQYPGSQKKMTIHFWRH